MVVFKVLWLFYAIKLSLFWTSSCSKQCQDRASYTNRESHMWAQVCLWTCHVHVCACMPMPHMSICAYVASNGWLWFFLVTKSNHHPLPPFPTKQNLQYPSELGYLVIHVKAAYPYLRNHSYLNTQCWMSVILYSTVLHVHHFFRSCNSSCVRNIQRSIFLFIVHMGIIVQDIW
jgi:hypothetical protein